MYSPNQNSPKMEQSGNVKIMTFTGKRIQNDFDNPISEELAGLSEQPASCHLLLDFSNVESISSAELGTLIGLHKRMKSGGGRLTLFNLNFQVFEVFAITHLHTLFGICREKMLQA